MANLVTNIGKGRFVYYAGLPAADDSLIAVVLATLMAYAARLFLQMVHETGQIGRVATKPTQAKEDAVNAGIIVCFSASNGGWGFPAQMPLWQASAVVQPLPSSQSPPPTVNPSASPSSFASRSPVATSSLS